MSCWAGIRWNGEVASFRAIRTPEVTNNVYLVADNAEARAVLVQQQQNIVALRGAAPEGRDATTVICPDATLKAYLDASVEERPDVEPPNGNNKAVLKELADIQVNIAARRRTRPFARLAPCN